MCVSGNPEELWSAFKTTMLDVAGGCRATHHQVKENFVSQGTLDTIEQSRRAGFNGRAELFRELRRKTVCADGGQGGQCARNLWRGITCGQVILILLTEELVHCIPPSRCLGVLLHG